MFEQQFNVFAGKYRCELERIRRGIEEEYAVKGPLLEERLRMADNLARIDLLWLKGRVKNAMLDFPGALEAYEEAIRLNPNNGNLYFSLGSTLFLTGNRPAAERAYYLGYVNNGQRNIKILFNQMGHLHLGSDPEERDMDLCNVYDLQMAGYSPLAWMKLAKKTNFKKKFFSYMDRCTDEGRIILRKMHEKNSH